MANNRVFYACQAVAINGNVVEGAQSVGMTTTFDLEPVFQLGQLDPYDIIPVQPSVEITMNRALAEGVGTVFSGNFAEVAAANNQNICVSVGDDTAPLLTAPSFSVYCTGAAISSVTYNFPVEGAFTEEITFSAKHKQVGGCSAALGAKKEGNVKFRQYFQPGASTLPAPVAGQHISNITISANLNREYIYELGRYEAYYSYVNFPVEVTCEFTVIATSLDSIAVSQQAVGQCASPTDNPKTAIKISACGNTFDLGDQCRLTSVTYGGGDAGGGNAEITYSYSTYNTLTVG